MSLNRKTASITAFSILGLGLVAFLFNYASAYLASSVLFSYVSEYFTTACEALLPLFSSVAMFCVYAVTGSRKIPLIHAIFYALSRFAVIFLEYTVSFASAGHEIGSALLFSLLLALLACVIVYVELSVLFFIIVFASRKFATHRYGGFEASDYIHRGEAFDFSNPVTVGIFSAASLLFLYNLVVEILNTASYISECSGVYLFGEILYIIFRYVFILALLLFSHFICFTAKSLFVKQEKDEE